MTSSLPVEVFEPTSHGYRYLQSPDCLPCRLMLIAKSKTVFLGASWSGFISLSPFQFIFFGLSRRTRNNNTSSIHTQPPERVVGLGARECGELGVVLLWYLRGGRSHLVCGAKGRDSVRKVPGARAGGFFFPRALRLNKVENLGARSGEANSVSNSFPSCREEHRARELWVLGISDPRLGVVSACCSHHLCVCVDLDRV